MAAATRLAQAVAASPPLALRERVLTAASVTRQLPPKCAMLLAWLCWLQSLAAPPAAAGP